jgi:hypothetical protein
MMELGAVVEEGDNMGVGLACDVMTPSCTADKVDILDLRPSS